MSVAEKIEAEESNPRETRARPGFSPRFLTDIVSLVDAAMIFSAGCLAHLLYFSFFATGSWQLTLTASALAAIAGVILFRRQGLYELRRLVRWWERVGRLGLSWLTVFVALVTIGFLVKVAGTYSRGWALTWFVVGLVLLVIGRALVGWFLQRSVERGQLQQQVAIVGCGEQANLLVDRLTDESGLVNIVGVYDCDPNLGDRKPSEQGTLSDLIQLAQRRRVDSIILALPRSEEKLIWQVTEQLASLPVHIGLSPETFDIRTGQTKEQAIGSLRTTVLLQAPLSDWSRILKAAEDRIFSIAILLFFLPTMLLIACAIKLDSPGPVFFRQKRHGLNHEIIPVWKFRTMRVMEEGGDVTQASKHDSRITRVGQFLRRSSLDELPQLFNVVKGEMSLVGPRPHAIAHNEQYGAIIGSYTRRHRVKPGITGWAQINGYRGEIREASLMEKRIEFDLYYIENWSLWFDIKIILLTPLHGLIHPNAY
jgi:Undecaprenyl-phosphate glucose phosphotransferase